MAIHEQQKIKMSGGIAKGIVASAMDMVLDNLQKYQYSYPIKSCTRELICNGIDSLAEKEVAINILTGKRKVEDYFADLQGDVYEDSRFDPGYYNLAWLSKENTVEMRYVCGRHMQKDRVIISDTGVGMSIARLTGYFQLGFSTKRLSKLPLGKFGVGAKSPLSTNIPFYTVESRYNGHQYRFNVYMHDVDSIIPALNLETGKENPYVIIDNGTEYGYKVYWQPTKQPNGVTVTMETKKIHKQQYIDAVKSQLLYFDDIHFVIEQENGQEEVIEYKAPILYEDEHIVLSDNQYYTKPHLLLNKVNYGYEGAPYYGNIV